ncbi:hypothetical protein YWA314_05709 [Yersinia enterocolitica subsp. enterocolitica WA-314]|nr:hypothetical protein YWA314_05709 [Yersinia enterocolitica subsp. enterocolitica WA-314]
MNLALRKDVGGCQPLKVANYSHSFLIAIYYGLVYFLNDKTPNIHIADTMTLSLVGLVEEYSVRARNGVARSYEAVVS